MERKETLRFLRKEGRYKRENVKKRKRGREKLAKIGKNKSRWVGQCFFVTDAVSMLRDGDREAE